ncbi:unnamed protein product [Gulo gulo]|uniref:Uncharacterized protein n=1 Tax=Gulo gulo TaxID=48420 RepID=A0A9X9LQH8_GULGU|nr:unnamed protein product [Gulo gulo]
MKTFQDTLKWWIYHTPLEDEKGSNEGNEPWALLEIIPCRQPHPLDQAGRMAAD